MQVSTKENLYTAIKKVTASIGKCAYEFRQTCDEIQSPVFRKCC